MRQLRFMGMASVLALLAACGDGGEEPDAATDPGRDAGPGVDGDAATPPGADAGDDGDDGGVDPGADAAAPTDDGGAVAGALPDAAGPWTVTTAEGSVTRASRTTPVVGYVPDGAGPYPLVVFAPGFQLESRRYEPLCERLASHGFVVVRADPDAGSPFVPGSTNHVEMRDDLIAVIDWATGDAPFAGSVDASRIGATGHSLGGKLATMVAAQDERVGALLGIDPVDGGGGPLGGSEATPDIVPSESSSITAPVGFIGETTNAEASGGFFAMACAPADQNFQQFYEGTAAARWAAEWEVADADHMDFVWDKSGCTTCGACQPEGTADEDAVRAATATVTVAFFRRHLAGEAAMDPYLTGDRVPAGWSTRSR
jgi:pimeloyl-ACP methyl ester carboxylesterase